MISAIEKAWTSNNSYINVMTTDRNFILQTKKDFYLTMFKFAKILEQFSRELLGNIKRKRILFSLFLSTRETNRQRARCDEE